MGGVIRNATCCCSTCDLCACWDPQGGAASDQPDTIAEYVLEDDGSPQVNRGVGHVHGSSWDFPGTDGPNDEWLRLVDADFAALDFLSDDFSIACWVKRHDLSTAVDYFYSVAADLPAPASAHLPYFEVYAFRNAAPFAKRLIVYVNGVNFFSTLTVEQDIWTHIVVRWDDDTQAITVNVDDGVSQSNNMGVDMEEDEPDQEMYVGQSVARSSRGFNGEMDALKIWCYRITDAEVTADYNAGKGVVCCGPFA